MLDTSTHVTDCSSDLAAKLRDAIISGRFMPNERLIEADLANAYKVNRANVRIALAMLDQEGLVVRERNRGARVRLVTDEEALEIAEARRVIEAMVARQAAERANDRQKAALRALMARMRAAYEKQDFNSYSQRNVEMHRAIQDIAANATANRLLQTLKSQVVRLQYRAILQSGRPAKSLAEHGEIVDAICANDAPAAESAMRRHLCAVKNALRQAMQAAKQGAY
ncbi:MAG: GntR family transcriptional regulator [Alphaproteobacteria bacterium]|nr:GntR family transcriptional regulator [Alphaproteobacteria bacterium]